MNRRTYDWYKIFDREDEVPLLPSGIGLVKVRDKDICVTKFQGRWLSFTNVCPHAGAPLSEGCLDGKGNITCPVHNYRFNIINGRETNDEGYRLTTYPIEERQDGVFLGIKKQGLFSWL